MSVGTTPVLLSNQIAPKEQRELLIVTNTSTGGQIIYIAWNTEAASALGQPIYPTASWNESIDNNFIPSNARITVVSSAASGTISVQERIRDRAVR